jgi:hypothetical protein
MSEVQITPDMQTIVEATQWLTVNPETHGGHFNGQTDRWYVIEESATTDDGSTLSPRGIYFGHRATYAREGYNMEDQSIKLVNHADPSSYQDYVPRTFVSSDASSGLWQGGRESVNLIELAKFPEEKLARMARNAGAVLAHYGVELAG